MSRRWGHLVILAVLLGLLAGCAGEGRPSAPQGAERGVLRIAMQYDAGNLDPQVLTSVTDQQLTVNIYEGLLRYRYGTTELGPGLATAWKSSPDGKTWEFTLRQGVKFHKGYGEMKASDVKFSLERLVSPELKSPNAPQLKALDRVEVVDDYHVRLHLKEADPALLDKLAQWYTAVVSERAVKEKGEKFSHDPVGTGPYQFDHWTPQTELVLVPFDEHWSGRRPGLARVAYIPISDATTMYNAFEAGDVDLIQVTDPQKLKKYRADPKFTVDETPGLITRFMGMNTRYKPFDDIRVRQAVLHAVNKQYIVDHVFEGISTPARSILAPGVMHAEMNIQQYEYDPEKARRLLAEAGYAGGFKTSFYVPNIDRFTKPATVIYENLRAVGIEAEIQVMDAQAFLGKLMSEEGVPMFILSRGQEVTPDRVLYSWFHSRSIPSGNWANIRDPEIDRWLDEAVSTLDEGRRRELFSLVQKKVAAGAYYLFIDHENMIFAMHSYVKGFKGDGKRSLRLDEVYIDRSG